MEKVNVWDILLWLMMAILLFMILTRVFGNSATDVQIYLGIITSMIVIVGYMMKLMENDSKLNREIGEIKTNMSNSFDKVREDMRLIKDKLKIN